MTEAMSWTPERRRPHDNNLAGFGQNRRRVEGVQRKKKWETGKREAWKKEKLSFIFFDNDSVNKVTQS